MYDLSNRAVPWQFQHSNNEDESRTDRLQFDGDADEAGLGL